MNARSRISTNGSTAPACSRRNRSIPVRPFPLDICALGIGRKPRARGHLKMSDDSGDLARRGIGVAIGQYHAFLASIAARIATRAGSSTSAYLDAADLTIVWRKLQSLRERDSISDGRS